MSEARGPDPQVEDVEIGPYGPRGKDTPPIRQMLGGYGIIFLAALLIPLLFLLVRFVIL